MIQQDDCRKARITWLILTYDSTAEQRFPLIRKWYVFNHDRATDPEATEVFELVSPKTVTDLLPKPDIQPGQGYVTFSLGLRSHDKHGCTSLQALVRLPA